MSAPKGKSQRRARITSILSAFTVALALCALCAICMLPGCANGQDEPTSNADTTADSPEAANTREVTDPYGRAVHLPKQVKTCATVGSATRFVVYAGAQDKLIAITEIDKRPSTARPYTEVYASLFANLPATSNGNHLMETSVDAEQLLTLRPDVIISSRSAEECDQLQQQTNIPVLGIPYATDMFGDDVLASLQIVGDALGTTEHVATAIDALKQWQTDLTARTQDIPDEKRPLCYAGGVNYKGMKGFTGTSANYAPFKAANILNATDQTKQSSTVEISLEQLSEWNPDFMFLNASNMDLLRDDYASHQALFDQMTAFRKGQLYAIPAFNMNGINVEIGVCSAYFIGSTVYPEQFSDIDVAQKYDEVFSVLLGSEYYGQMKSLGMDFASASF